MGHNPATRDVKTSERKKVLETRSPEDIIKGIRGNLAAHLSVTPSDIAFLLAQYDQKALALAGALLTVQNADAEIKTLQEQVDRFREVYEQENRSHALVLSSEGVAQMTEELATGVGPAGEKVS